MSIYQPQFPLQVLQNITDRKAFNSTTASLIDRIQQVRVASKELESFLQKFATSHNLGYFNHKFEYWLFGPYRGYEFVYYINTSQKKLNFTCAPSAPETYWKSKYEARKNEPMLNKQVTVDTISTLFSSRLHNPFQYPIQFNTSGDKLFYEEDGIWLSESSLQQRLDTLCDFADAYAECCAKITAIGGEAISALQEIAHQPDHKLYSVAIQLLTNIAQTTVGELENQALYLICPYCITRCAAHRVVLPSKDTVTYYGCRVCGQSRKFLTVKGQIVAVLNNQVSAEQMMSEDVLRVNWLLHRRLFDFDYVEIVQAEDEDVERFAVQVGNDTDLYRKPHYQTMQCTVAMGCNLSMNTLKILR